MTTGREQVRAHPEFQRLAQAAPKQNPEAAAVLAALFSAPTVAEQDARLAAEQNSSRGTAA